MTTSMEATGIGALALRRKPAGESAAGRHRIWSTVRSGNAPSFRVLTKLGFRRHHTMTDDGELVWLMVGGACPGTVRGRGTG